MTATNMCSNFGGFRCRPPLNMEEDMTYLGEPWNRCFCCLGHRWFDAYTANLALMQMVMACHSTSCMNKASQVCEKI